MSRCFNKCTMLFLANPTILYRWNSFEMFWTNTFRVRRCSGRSRRLWIGAGMATFSPMTPRRTGWCCIDRQTLPNPAVTLGDTDCPASGAGFYRNQTADNLALAVVPAVAGSACHAGSAGIVLRTVVPGSILDRPGRRSDRNRTASGSTAEICTVFGGSHRYRLYVQPGDYAGLRLCRGP